MTVQYENFINGAWQQATTRTTIDSEDPYTGEVWATIQNSDAEEANKAVEAASDALRGEWGMLSASTRGKILWRWADAIEANAKRLIELEVRDNGKIIREIENQVHYLPEYLRYFGGLADKIEGRVLPIDKRDVFNYTLREPLGVCVAITAWNSPLLLAVNKIAPGLAAGNTFVVKPSEFTSVSTLELARIGYEAGLPRGVLNVVTGYGNTVGAALVNHPDVKKIAFTGSDQSGSHIYQVAAKSLKKVTLELGGKSANIVFSDADIDNAVRGVVSGILGASGQTCVAGSRLLVDKRIYDEFTDKVTREAMKARIGNPMDRETEIGPITTEVQYKKILEYIAIADREGAKILGERISSYNDELPPGRFIRPTVLANVDNNMQVAREEIFGPVLCAIPFDDEDEAVSIANDTKYGLAAGIWTSDIAKTIRIPKKLQTGIVWVNMYRAVSYMSPFGGYKSSGLGRENGIEALDEYLQTKSIWVNESGIVSDPFSLG